MSGLTEIETKDACLPIGPYSQAVKAGPFLFVSGQIPINTDGTLIEGSITDKTIKALQNLKAILAAGGSSLDKVTKVTVFLTSMDDFAAMNAGYEQVFQHKPARSCVAVKELPKGVPVEVEAIALLD